MKYTHNKDFPLNLAQSTPRIIRSSPTTQTHKQTNTKLQENAQKWSMSAKYYVQITKYQLNSWTLRKTCLAVDERIQILSPEVAAGAGGDRWWVGVVWRKKMEKQAEPKTGFLSFLQYSSLPLSLNYYLFPFFFFSRIFVLP